MVNYKEEKVTGEIIKWRRANIIKIDNHLDKTPVISFNEVEMQRLPDGTTNGKVVDVLKEDFNDSTKSIDLLNPADNSIIGNATYQDFYIMLYSLYIKLAKERDTANEKTNS